MMKQITKEDRFLTLHFQFRLSHLRQQVFLYFFYNMDEIPLFYDNLTIASANLKMNMMYHSKVIHNVSIGLERSCVING